MLIADIQSKTSTPAVIPPLHYCLFGPKGSMRTANYDIPASELESRDAQILAAYGVTPHPDMPDGVRRRVQHRLSQHIGAAGYYYCQDKAGAPFWISVALYPTSEGTLGVHFNATSPKLNDFAHFYARLREAEDAGLGPEESAARLVAWTDKHGVEDYRTMAASIMLEEMDRRVQSGAQKDREELKMLFDMIHALRRIEEYGQRVSELFEQSKQIPYNMMLQAARLEGRHGPISVIATNHQQLNNTLMEITGQIHSATMLGVNRVSEALAYMGIRNLVAELVHVTRSETGENIPADPLAEAGFAEVSQSCFSQFKSVMEDLEKGGQSLFAICRDMRRALSAMELTRMMCKIERSNMEGDTDGLSEIVNRLQASERNLSGVMTRIEDALTLALSSAQKLSRRSAAAGS